ncbi:MAG: T9SS type A sorting domain-containing protein [Bacteroidota bacterium]
MKPTIAFLFLFCSLFVIDLPASNFHALSSVKQEGEPQSARISLSVYPNPTSSYLYIKGEGLHNEEASILNLLGKEVKKLAHINDQDKIDVSDLKPGVYFFQLSREVLIRFIKE